MSLLLKHAWSDLSADWKESHLQAGIVNVLRKDTLRRKQLNLQQEYLFAGSLEGIRLAPIFAMQAKMQGMERGEPDLRFYFHDAVNDVPVCLLLELKLKGNKTSDVQEERHSILAGFGFDVRVVTAACPHDAIILVLEILAEYDIIVQYQPNK